MPWKVAYSALLYLTISVEPCHEHGSARLEAPDRKHYLVQTLKDDLTGG